MSKIFNASTKTVFKYGSTTAGAAAIVNDVLTPLSKLGVWVAVIAILIALIVFAVGRKNPNAFDTYSSTMKELWYWPLALCFILISISTIGMSLFNKSNDNKSGVLSKNSEVIKLLQKDLGILNEINDTLESIDSTTKEINTNLGNINKTVESVDKNAQETVNLLTNNNFSEYDFIESVTNADIPKLRNYFDNYWKETYSHPRMLGEIFILFEAIRLNQSASISDVLELFYQEGKFEPSKIYNHPLPMNALSVIYQRMVETPINVKNKNNEDKYKLAKANFTAQKKANKEEIDSKAEQHCESIKEQNIQAKIDHEKAGLEWDLLYKQALERTNKKRIDDYKEEVAALEKEKVIAQQERDAFQNKSIHDFKSYDEYIKESSTVELRYVKSIYSSTPMEPMMVNYPDNYDELIDEKPAFSAPSVICNLFQVKNDISKALTPPKEVEPYDTDYAPSLGASKLSLMQYALAVKNENAIQYLRQFVEESQSIQVQLFDYKHNLIFESVLIEDI